MYQLHYFHTHSLPALHISVIRFHHICMSYKTFIVEIETPRYILLSREFKNEKNTIERILIKIWGEIQIMFCITSTKYKKNSHNSLKYLLFQTFYRFEGKKIISYSCFNLQLYVFTSFLKKWKKGLQKLINKFFKRTINHISLKREGNKLLFYFLVPFSLIYYNFLAFIFIRFWSILKWIFKV